MTPFIKLIALAATGLLAVLFAILGWWLANRDGYFSGGVCIALSPVFAFLCGMLFYRFASDNLPFKIEPWEEP